MRWGLIALFLVIAVGGTYLAQYLRRSPMADRFSFQIIEQYPHDPTSFTQGLFFDNGFLWESTGRYGESKVRKLDLKTGEVLDEHKLSDQYFGEGMAVLGDQLFQLTWKEGVALVYDRELNEVKQFKYDGEGWGLTTNGTDLIFSNGTPEIKFLDPKTFKERSSIWVRRKSGRPAGRLNELEYSIPNKKIYANNYLTDEVLEIDPETGTVTKVIDLSGLWPSKDRPEDGVLNGIAINPETGKLLVTGKLCPKVFELNLVPAQR